jgi:hypothetical protein
MRWKLTDETDTPTYVVVLDPGEEAFAVISGFARCHELTAAQVTAVGAFESATVGWFDRQARRYRPIEVDERDHPRRAPAGRPGAVIGEQPRG